MWIYDAQFVEFPCEHLIYDHGPVNVRNPEEIGTIPIDCIDIKLLDVDWANVRGQMDKVVFWNRIIIVK